MKHGGDVNRVLRIIDAVDNAILAHADSPQVLRIFEFSTAWWPRRATQALDRSRDAEREGLSSFPSSFRAVRANVTE